MPHPNPAKDAALATEIRALRARGLGWADVGNALSIPKSTIRKLASRVGIVTGDLRAVTELHECAVTGCRIMVQRRPGDSPSKYALRKACSPEHSRMLRWENAARINFTQSPLRQQKPSLSKEPLPPISAADAAAAIARFLEERGVTKCPPAFCAPSPQGALQEADAAKRLDRVGTKDMSWRDQISAERGAAFARREAQP